MDNNYKILAKKINQILNIKDKQILVEIKKQMSNKNINFEKLEINNINDVEKYYSLFLSLIKIYTDIMILCESE